MSTPAASPTADREIVLTREFDAPRDLVWRAFSEPDQIVRWWGPNGFTTTIKKWDFRVGGEWSHTMHGPDGTDSGTSLKLRGEFKFTRLFDPIRRRVTQWTR